MKFQSRQQSEAKVPPFEDIGFLLEIQYSSIEFIPVMVPL